LSLAQRNNLLALFRYLFADLDKFPQVTGYNVEQRFMLA
jgi:hypothetical protein